MCSCFAFPATIYPAAEHSRALFNNRHGTLVCVMFRNVCVHFDFLACMLRARRVLPGQSGGSVGGSVPTSAMFYLPACTWVTCNSYTKRTQLPSAHPKGKTNPHCVLPQIFGYLSAFTCRALHTLFAAWGQYFYVCRGVFMLSWRLHVSTCTHTCLVTLPLYVCRVQDYWEGYKLFCYAFY